MNDEEEFDGLMMIKTQSEIAMDVLKNIVDDPQTDPVTAAKVNIAYRRLDYGLNQRAAASALEGSVVAAYQRAIAAMDAERKEAGPA
jgi:hypothetical protein